MPSWELFEAQPQAYRHTALPPQIRARVAIEAAVPLGWERYIGQQGAVIALDRFGASAPYKVLAEQWGFTPGAIADRVKEYLGKY